MPASGQHITGSKADIFTPVNPLGGAATDEDKSIQEAMTEEVDKRMRNAVEDLREKYATVVLTSKLLNTVLPVRRTGRSSRPLTMRKPRNAPSDT